MTGIPSTALATNKGSLAEGKISPAAVEMSIEQATMSLRTARTITAAKAKTSIRPGLIPRTNQATNTAPAQVNLVTVTGARTLPGLANRRIGKGAPAATPSRVRISKTTMMIPLQRTARLINPIRMMTTGSFLVAIPAHNPTEACTSVGFFVGCMECGAAWALRYGAIGYHFLESSLFCGPIQLAGPLRERVAAVCAEGFFDLADVPADVAEFRQQGHPLCEVRQAAAFRRQLIDQWLRKKGVQFKILIQNPLCIRRVEAVSGAALRVAVGAPR